LLTINQTNLKKKMKMITMMIRNLMMKIMMIN